MTRRGGGDVCRPSRLGSLGRSSRRLAAADYHGADSQDDADYKENSCHHTHGRHASDFRLEPKKENGQRSHERHQHQYPCHGGETGGDQGFNGDRLALLDQVLSPILDPILDRPERPLKPADTHDGAEHQFRPRPIMPITTPTTSAPARAPRGLLRLIRSNSEANVFACSEAALAIPDALLPIWSATSDVVFFALSTASLPRLAMKLVTVSFRALKSARSVSRSALMSLADAPGARPDEPNDPVLLSVELPGRWS